MENLILSKIALFAQIVFVAFSFKKNLKPRECQFYGLLAGIFGLLFCITNVWTSNTLMYVCYIANTGSVIFNGYFYFFHENKTK